MGWAHGTTTDGREVGYAVEATCEADGCDEPIDRGLAYACGGWHDPTPYSCGHHFCAAHLTIVDLDSDLGVELTVGQLCPSCAANAPESAGDRQ